MVTSAMLDDWLDGVRCRVNDKQFDFLELVVDRVKAEYNLPRASPSACPSAGSEPLRYLLHGPPGTGKSHALSYIKELFDKIGLEQGLDWEVVAFQNSNAAALGGLTIHAAFGFKQCQRSNEDQAISPEVVKRAAHWRWLFVDEISLVPANLFALMDRRLREIKASADEWKTDAQGRARPFGGVNILASGDFGQLPPVSGGYLADIPAHLKGEQLAAKRSPDALQDAGRVLLWDEFQGVVELTERERCKDSWWNEVTDQLRDSNLSPENHKYLHGVPVAGCRLSHEERVSRRRVITGPDDERLHEPRFQEAPAVVATNDSKYQINKDRARKYAGDADAELRWSIAKDVASSEVLKKEYCDKHRKLRRLV